ncbi:MAG: hypothetical protein EOM10_13690 [Opitutae bacterium]|nr:hypothetical protein [Opitutae bacterium]
MGADPPRRPWQGWARDTRAGGRRPRGAAGRRDTRAGCAHGGGRGPRPARPAGSGGSAESAAQPG